MSEYIYIYIHILTEGIVAVVHNRSIQMLVYLVNTFMFNIYIYSVCFCFYTIVSSNYKYKSYMYIYYIHVKKCLLMYRDFWDVWTSKS